LEKILLKPSKLYLALSSLTLLVLTSTPALSHAETGTEASAGAEPAAEDQVKKLDTVIVTAQYKAQNLQEVPAAVTAVSGKDLSAKGASFIGEVLNYAPNAAADNPDGDTRPRWYVRGLGTGDVSASTVFPLGIYADGVYLNAPIAGAGDLFDLERIEVLRGPQGTLYGKNTTAGAVNFISRKPSLSEQATGQVSLGLGDYDLRTLEAAVNSKVTDRIAVRAAFYSEERDGFANNLATGEHYGDVDKKSFRIQVLGKISDHVDALLKLNHQRIDDNGSNGSLAVGRYWGVYQRPEGRDTNLDLAESTELQHDGLSLTLNAQLDNGWRLTSISAFDRTENTSILDGDYTPYDVSRSYSDNQWTQYSQELRLASDEKLRWSWIAGLHYFNEDLDAQSVSARVNSSLPNGASAQTTSSPAYRNVSYSQKNQSFALFANNTFKLTDKFKITAGLRWTWEEKDIDLDLVQITTATYSGSGAWWKEQAYSNAVYNSTAGANGNAKRSSDWSELTYDFTPEYQIRPNINSYFRYSHGFKSGGFNTGLTGNVSQLAIVDPEYLDSYELGLKSSLLDGRLIANANIFYYDYQDIQTNLLVNVQGEGGGVTSVLTNGPKAEVKGGELELDYLATDQLRLRLAAAYLDSEYTDFVDRNPVTNVVSADNTGNSLVRAPKYTLAVGGDYTFYLGNGARLVLGTDASYRDRVYFLVNRQDQSVDPELSQAGFTLWNANLGYYSANQKYQINAYVKNLFDKDYQVHGRPNGTAGQYVITYGNPRQIGASVTLRF
jgi:iron complex outermembrane receptor protein